MPEWKEGETPPDSGELLERVRRNDEAAAKDLVDRLYPLVIKIVRSHRPRRMAEEDLAQDIYLKIFSKLDQYAGNVPLEHWVSRIAVNTCLDHLRAQKVRPELRWADLTEDEAAALDAVIKVESLPHPAHALGARELVGKLLDMLGPEDRTVITLLDLQGLSIEEIRQRTGWKDSFIKVRAFRARLKLRKFWMQLEKPENR
jgi:RNA polymerase sigma-70 factor (ECF subfamily)